MWSYHCYSCEAGRRRVAVGGCVFLNWETAVGAEAWWPALLGENSEWLWFEVTVFVMHQGRTVLVELSPR